MTCVGCCWHKALGRIIILYDRRTKHKKKDNSYRIHRNHTLESTHWFCYVQYKKREENKSLLQKSLRISQIIHNMTSKNSYIENVEVPVDIYLAIPVYFTSARPIIYSIYTNTVKVWVIFSCFSYSYFPVVVVLFFLYVSLACGKNIDSHLSIQIMTANARDLCGNNTQTEFADKMQAARAFVLFVVGHVCTICMQLPVHQTDRPLCGSICFNH